MGRPIVDVLGWGGLARLGIGRCAWSEYHLFCLCAPLCMSVIGECALLLLRARSSWR